MKLTSILFILFEDPYYIIAVTTLLIIILIAVAWIFILLLRQKKNIGIIFKKVENIVNDIQLIQETNLEEEILESNVDLIKEEDISTEVESQESLDIITNKLQTRYNYSFISRLHLAPRESQERFSKLKNFLLKYDGMKVRKTWRYEIFILKGEIIAKVWIYNNAMDVYNNLDEILLETIDYDKKSDKIMHEKTPVLCKILNNLNLKRLISAFEKKLENEKTIENFVEKDYQVDYISKEELLKMGLIKIKEGKIK